MKRSPVEVFSEWADLDKDYGMEKNHKESVENMLSFATKQQKPFSFIDAGCGNGWVVRKVSENPMCIKAEGIDGSDKMIKKAKSIDPKHRYSCADLMTWNPKEKVDLVHSMEVFYYLDNPKEIIQKISNQWLNLGGTIDYRIGFLF